MEQTIFDLIQAKKQAQELSVLIACNSKTERFGLSLTKEQAEELMVCRDDALRKYRRVEFGAGILDGLIFAFCDSQYLNQDNYAETLAKLQEIFYLFKNETQDRLTDDELLVFMKEQFESVCFGDTDYLAETCLSRYASALRAGYDGYRASGGHHDYEEWDEEERWDKELYRDVLKEMIWR